MTKRGELLSPETKEKNRVRSLEYYNANLDRLRDLRLQRVYSITTSQYEAMWTEQDGRCAICKCIFEGTSDARVDHDHACCPGVNSCGRCIRGLLCQTCNGGLGFFRDNPQTLFAAIEYLENV